MKALSWALDWTVITVCPWLAIYFLWNGPILAGLALLALLALALGSRISRQ